MPTYFSIKPIEEILFKEKSSKFLGFAFPIQNEDDIKNYLTQIKTKHPKATHHCYAYRLGLDKNNFRMNDDGEPSGTAGKPILGQIDSFSITDCLVVVVRYFGGTKLGVSGLIQAYKECAKLTLSSTEIIELKTLSYYKINCDYEHLNRWYKIVEKFNLIIIKQEISTNATFEISIEEEKNMELETILSLEKIEFKKNIE
ncbi:MAG: YigZ family protein [Bacteroidetes bacterium]|nr:YigZ family protein [Bacteroidota bacterium]